MIIYWLMAHFIFYFKYDLAKKEEMLNLRRQGWSYTALAEKYECPKLAIRGLARKHGLGEETVTVQFTRTDYLSIPSTTSTQPKERTMDDINPGKTYAEYLKEAEERKKHLHGQNTSGLSPLL